MNIWVIVFIGLALAMAVGPIMMFRPNQRDRRLTELRQAAAQKGIRVRLASVEQSGKKQSVAVYSSPIANEEPRSNEQQSAEWVLIKQTFQHDVHFDGYWDWENKSKAAPNQYHDALKAMINDVDDSILGIELRHTGVGIWWTERTLSISDIDAILTRLKSIL